MRTDRPRRHRWPGFAGMTLVSALGFAPGCQSPAPVPTPPLEEVVAPDAEPLPDDPREVTVQSLGTGRVIIYPVRWERVEELAATIAPILESRYGPGVRIVPHRNSNSLLIFLPPERGEGASGPQTGLAPVPRVPR